MSPDSKKLVSAGRDKKVYVHDLVTGEQIGAFEGHQTWVFKLFVAHISISLTNLFKGARLHNY